MVPAQLLGGLGCTGMGFLRPIPFGPAAVTLHHDEIDHFTDLIVIEVNILPHKMPSLISVSNFPERSQRRLSQRLKACEAMNGSEAATPSQNGSEKNFSIPESSELL